MAHKVYKVKDLAASGKWRIRGASGVAGRAAGRPAWRTPACPPSGAWVLLPQPGKELDLLRRLVGFAAVMLVEWPHADVFGAVPVVVGSKHG
jgi:hypothetical protein